MNTNYKGLCTQFYDADKPQPPIEELEHYKWALSEVRGPIIEPMCGSGRFLVPLLSLGYDMYGFDSSAEMVQACRKKINEPNRIRIASFDTYETDIRFSACIIPAGSFSLLAAPEEALRALQAIRNMVHRSAICHIEICTRNPALDYVDSVSSRSVTANDGTFLTIISTSRWDLVSSIENVVCHYIQTTNKGIVATETESYGIRWYEEGEFQRLAEACGFDIINQIENAYDNSHSLFILKPNNGLHSRR